jgi:hypothetical protein
MRNNSNTNKGMINSIKLKTTLIAIAIMAVSSTTFAQMTVGGRIGPNFSNLHGSSVDNNKGLVGLNIGGTFNYAMEEYITSDFGKRFSLQGEFTLQTKGSKYNVPGTDLDADKQVLTYVQIPVLGHYTYPVNDKIEVFGEAGFFLGALFGVTVDGEKSRVVATDPKSGEQVTRKWREEYKGFDAGIAIGAGGMMPIPDTKLKGYLNLRYSLGLMNIGDFSTKSEGFQESDLSGIKTGVFSIMVGVTYPLN